MSLNTRHLYHPFGQSSLGFSLSSNLHENRTSLIIEDIDLYYQPLPNPAIATIQFLLKLTYTVLGEFVHFKLLNMVNKENGLVNEVTQFCCIVSLVVNPVGLLYETATDFFHPLKEIVGNVVCAAGRIIIYLHTYVAIFHSFITALMRYVFIIHEERVRAIGKTKTKRIFLILAISIPIVFVTWELVENQEFDMFLFLNKCYGIDHKVFLAELSTGKEMFCKMTPFGTNEHHPFTIKMREYTCIIKFVLSLVAAFNISEGFLYILIFSDIKRYDIFSSIKNKFLLIRL